MDRLANGGGVAAAVVPVDSGTEKSQRRLSMTMRNRFKEVEEEWAEAPWEDPWDFGAEGAGVLSAVDTKRHKCGGQGRYATERPSKGPIGGKDGGKKGKSWKGGKGLGKDKGGKYGGKFSGKVAGGNG